VCDQNTVSRVHLSQLPSFLGREPEPNSGTGKDSKDPGSLYT